jgi:hypothetical protein
MILFMKQRLALILFPILLQSTCSDVWCKGYQSGARQPIDSESPSNHTGFRCAMDAEGSASR